MKTITVNPDLIETATVWAQSNPFETFVVLTILTVIAAKKLAGA